MHVFTSAVCHFSAVPQKISTSSVAALPLRGPFRWLALAWRPCAHSCRHLATNWFPRVIFRFVSHSPFHSQSKMATSASNNAVGVGVQTHEGIKSVDGDYCRSYSCLVAGRLLFSGCSTITISGTPCYHSCLAIQRNRSVSSTSQTILEEVA